MAEFIKVNMILKCCVRVRVKVRVRFRVRVRQNTLVNTMYECLLVTLKLICIACISCHIYMHTKITFVHVNPFIWMDTIIV